MRRPIRWCAILAAASAAGATLAQAPDPRGAAEAARRGTPPQLYGAPIEPDPSSRNATPRRGGARMVIDPATAARMRAAQRVQGAGGGAALRGAAPQGFAPGGVPGFGPSGGAPPASAGEARAAERNQRYVEGMLRKYDRNGDRVLTQDEWSRIKGNPGEADADKDGRLTVDELLARVSLRQREKREAKSAGGGERRSNRLSTAAERLPDGLPGWFAERDKDQDGQVSMREYGPRNDSTARQFRRYDTDDDGFLSPDEARGAR